MENIKYSEKKEEIDIEKLNLLCKSVGWDRNIKKWDKILSRSSFVCSAWDKNKMVGFARVLEDGIMCMFYDICVLPEYQGKGIGKKIMKKLIEKIKNEGYVSIGLFTWEQNPNNIPFYENLGFERVDSGMELTKYMVRETG